MPTGRTGMEETRQHPGMAEEIAQGARIGDIISQTAKIGRGVGRLRSGGGDLRHPHQISEDEIRRKRSGAHAGGQALLDPLTVSRTTATKLHIREKLPARQGPAPLHHQIPTNAPSGALADHLLGIVGLDRETEPIDRSTMANDPHPALRVHPSAP